MTRREEELTEQLLAVLERHLGHWGDASERGARLAERSPTMLAAWAQATRSGAGFSRAPKPATDRKMLSHDLFKLA